MQIHSAEKPATSLRFSFQESLSAHWESWRALKVRVGLGRLPSATITLQLERTLLIGQKHSPEVVSQLHVTGGGREWGQMALACSTDFPLLVFAGGGSLQQWSLQLLFKGFYFYFYFFTPPPPRKKTRGTYCSYCFVHNLSITQWSRLIGWPKVRTWPIVVQLNLQVWCYWARFWSGLLSCFIYTSDDQAPALFAPTAYRSST